MPLRLDHDIAAALTVGTEAAEGIALPGRGDPQALRKVTNGTLNALLSAVPATPDVEVAFHETTSADGTSIPLRWYTHNTAKSESAIVYVHGGGMIGGSVEIYEPLVRHYVQSTGVSILAVDYRVAPEFPGTLPAEDAFAAVKWIFEKAKSLGIDTDRVAIMGDSGGGGVAAGASIIARDKGIQLARQILIYPMLDDRNTHPDVGLALTATWTYDNNYTGWHALLGDDIGSVSVSPIAAPARLDDFTNLAPAFIEVGELDIFRDESLDYARNLLAAGSSVELHLVPGAPHAHDLIGMALPIGQRSLEEKFRVIKSI